jgi:hypothetical protein
LRPQGVDFAQFLRSKIDARLGGRLALIMGRILFIYFWI